MIHWKIFAKKPKFAQKMEGQWHFCFIISSFTEMRPFTSIIFIFGYEKFQTVLIIETVLIFFSLQTLPLYWSYNRVILENFQTVLIIEQYLYSFFGKF